jgi:hypothetical protein
MTFFELLTSFLSVSGIPGSVLAITLALVVAWICVDFYEEHFG